MSARQLRILVIALAGLLVLWGGAQLLSRRSDTVQGSLSFPGVSSGSTDALVLIHAADTLRVTRSGERWSVNGHRASQQAVQDLFLALRDSSPPDVAAVSPSSFARMGVDSAGGRWLLVMSGGRSVLRLVIGVSGQDYGSGYVRRVGSDTVFLWRGRLPELVRRAPDQWRDHRIAAVPPDSVRVAEVERGGRRYTLRTQAHTWRLDGAAADSARVAAWLTRFRDLEATGFATDAQADSARRRRPRRSVTLRGAADTLLLRLSFDSTAAAYWVQRAGDSTVYRMDAWQVNELAPADSTLRPPAPAGTKPATRPR